MADVHPLVSRTLRRRPGIFLVGFPGSGTSLLTRLLEQFLGIDSASDNGAIVGYLNTLTSYGDLHDDRNAARLMSDVAAQQRWVEPDGARRAFDAASALAALDTRGYGDLLDAVFAQVASAHGMRRWCRYVDPAATDLGLLWTLFPDARFIHLVRDGRDILAALPTTSARASAACEMAGAWADSLAAVRAFAHRLPPGQVSEVAYEDLVRRPQATLPGLARFLGLRLHDGPGLWCVTSSGRADDGSPDGWRDILTRAEVERFEGMAGGWLERYGYALEFHGTARRLLWHEQLYWRLHGRASRFFPPFPRSHSHGRTPALTP